MPAAGSRVIFSTVFLKSLLFNVIMADGSSEIPQPNQTAKPEEKKPQVILNRRQFLQGAGATALSLFIPAVPSKKPPLPDSVPAPAEAKYNSTEIKGVLGEYKERDPIPFPEWAVPVFEPLWTYMDKIGKIFGIDPRIVMGYMAMESKGNMSAHSGADAQGVMQIIPGPSTSEGWMRCLTQEDRYHDVVDKLREIGIDIADANYRPYPIVSDPDNLSKMEVNNLYSMFNLVLGIYKLTRDYQGERNFGLKQREFLRKIPDFSYDPNNNEDSYKLENAEERATFTTIAKDVPRIIIYFLGDQNPLYTKSVLGHMAPYKNIHSLEISDNLRDLYNDGLYMAGTENGLDKVMKDVYASQKKVFDSMKVWQENLPENHPSKHVALQNGPAPGDAVTAITRWRDMRKEKKLLTLS